MTVFKHRFGWVVVACLGAAALLGSVACGDDDGQQNNNNTQDAGVETDGWVGGTFTVAVYDSTDSTTFETPLAGATVALDPPFADRIEATTDANGEVEFDASLIDWSVGDAALSAHKPGYAIFSMVNVTEDQIREEQGRLKMALFPVYTYDSTALLTLSATHMERTDSTLYASPLAPDWYKWASQEGTSELSLEVPALVAFQLFVLEYKYDRTGIVPEPGWSQEICHFALVDVDAIQGATAAVTVDFDTDSLPYTTVSGHLSLPSDPNSVFRNDDITVNVYVVDKTEGRGHGWSTRVEHRADGVTVDYTVKAYDVPDYETTATQYTVTWRGQQSIIVHDGLPAAGAMDTPFLEPPTWVEPEDPRQLRSVFAPIEWEPAEEGLRAALAIMVGDQMLWGVATGPHANTIRVPDPPSSVDYNAMFAGRAITGQLRVGESEEESFYFDRVVIPTELRLAP